MSAVQMKNDTQHVVTKYY